MNRIAFLLALAVIGCGSTKYSESTKFSVSEPPHAFELRLSQTLLNPAVARDVQESTPIDKWSNGTYIYGQADQSGKVSIEMTTSPDDAHVAYIDTVYTAETVASTTGQQDPATFWATTWTQTVSRKRTTLTIDKFDTAAATTDASTEVQINGVDVDVRLFYNIALRRAESAVYGAIPQMQWETNSDVSQAINTKFDAEQDAATDATSGLSDLQAMAKTMREDTKAGDNIYFSSSAGTLNLVADETLTPTPPDAPATADGDVVARLDEAFINGSAVRTLGGQSLTEAEIRKRIGALFGPLMAEGANIEAVEDGISMLFPAKSPLRVTFEWGRLTLAIRGERFMTPNNTYDSPMEIKVVYTAATDGTPRLVRDGDISVLPVNHEPGRPMTMRQQALAGELKSRFRGVFEKEISKPILDLPGDALAKAGTLNAHRLEVSRGWLLAAWKLKK